MTHRPPVKRSVLASSTRSQWNSVKVKVQGFSVCKMTIEMIDKWVTSFRFNEIKMFKKCLIGFLIDFIFCKLAETTVSGSPSVTWFPRNDASLDSSVNCVCAWSTKKLIMPAYCVAANCNNSQTTPGITRHELPRNRPAVRRKWIKFIQFKRADFLAAHHAHLCSEHFSECDFANPMEYRMGFASKLARCSGTLSKSCLTGSNWYGCILVGLSGKVSVSSSELELAILQRLPRVT